MLLVTQKPNSVLTDLITDWNNSLVNKSIRRFPLPWWNEMPVCRENELNSDFENIIRLYMSWHLWWIHFMLNRLVLLQHDRTSARGKCRFESPQALSKDLSGGRFRKGRQHTEPVRIRLLFYPDRLKIHQGDQTCVAFHLPWFLLDVIAVVLLSNITQCSLTTACVRVKAAILYVMTRPRSYRGWPHWSLVALTLRTPSVGEEPCRGEALSLIF